MKTLILCCALALMGTAAFAQEGEVRIYNVPTNRPAQVTPADEDTVSMQIDNGHAYYQKVVKVDSSIKVSDIYVRTLQFMAAKNFQQNYGYDQEGKLIFTTTQDLNVSPVVVTQDNDDVEQYSTQFSITVDMKNGRYRYTINNVLFYVPAMGGNRRLTLYDMYEKMTNTDSKRIARNARNMVTSYERYIISLTRELHEDIEHKLRIHNPKF